ncbi:MAG: cupin protein [Haloplasmataceae bacterium]|nr:cupin protein [Haloplasmataceae bacterium]
MILKKEEQIVEEFPWGKLVWYASMKFKNSDNLTLGHCFIKQGCQNARHYHPNCEEILYVIKGKIRHLYEGQVAIILHEGDSIAIPANVLHCAINIGDTEAVMHISFSSNDRKTINV